MIYGFGRPLNTYQSSLQKEDSPQNLQNDLEINNLQIKGGTDFIEPKVSQNKIIGGMGPQELLQIKKNNHRAEIETGIIGSIFGPTAAYIIFYIGATFNILYSAFMAFIIFTICLVIYKVIQLGLDISHKVVTGLGKTMQDAVNKAVIPGFKIMGFRIPELKLLGFLQGPANDVKKADSKIPQTAYEVILLIIKAFFEPVLDF